MVKLGTFLPDVVKHQSTENRMAAVLGAISDNYMTKGMSSSDTYRTPTLGVDEIVNLWVRQQANYRENLVTSLHMIAATVLEVRAPVWHIQSEVFRRGVTWKPRFANKCPNCGTEYSNAVDECTTDGCDGHVQGELCAKYYTPPPPQAHPMMPPPPPPGHQYGQPMHPVMQMAKSEEFLTKDPFNMGQGSGMSTPSQGFPGQRSAMSGFTMPGTIPPAPGQILDPISHRWKRSGAASGAAPVPQEEEEPQDMSGVCKGPHLREPAEKQKERFDDFMMSANAFNHSLENELRQFHWDLNIIDDGFLYFTKEYKKIDNPVTGESEVRSKVLAIERVNPALIQYDLDDNGLPKNKSWVCYIHRDIDDRERAPGTCDECGMKKVPAMFVMKHRGRPMYLLESEVIHASKFAPSKLYGWSPILTIFDKVLTLVGMDKTLYRYFFERKMPASMVMVQTDDPKSLREERTRIEQQLRADPHHVPMIAVSNRNQRGRVDLVRLFHTLQEMEYLPVREEIRERIASMWGVTPAWQGSPEAFGGLSTQTSQLVVMSRVVEGDQRIFHEKVFPQMLEYFGITDWVLELPQPEEKAESTRLMFAAQRIAMAMQIANMPGMKLKLKSSSSDLEDVNFVISGQPENMLEYQAEQAQQQMEQQMQMEQGAQEGPPGGEQMSASAVGPTAEGQLTQLLNDQSMKTEVMQLMEAGFHAPDLIERSQDMKKVWFKSDGQDYVAEFGTNGRMTGFQKAKFGGGMPKNPRIPGFNRHENTTFDAQADPNLLMDPAKPDMNLDDI